MGAYLVRWRRRYIVLLFPKRETEGRSNHPFLLSRRFSQRAGTFRHGSGAEKDGVLTALQSG